MDEGGQEKSGRKKAFWITFIIDLVLLALATVLGLQVMHLLNPGSPVDVISPTQTQNVYVPLIVIIQSPDEILQSREFPLDILISNPDDEVVEIKQIALPLALMDNTTIIRSEPELGEKFSGDDGAGYTINLRIGPGEQKKISMVLVASKMQAVYGKLILYTDHTRQEKDLALVVAPLPVPPTADPSVSTPASPLPQTTSTP